jgi:hypothetical protein
MQYRKNYNTSVTPFVNVHTSIYVLCVGTNCTVHESMYCTVHLQTAVQVLTHTGPKKCLERTLGNHAVVA